MQRSTRIALLVVAAVLVSAVAGFIGGRIGSSSSSGQVTNTENLMAEIQARGELRVGVAPDPLSLVQANGTWTGPDLVPLEDLATTMKVKFTPVATSWNNMVAGLQANQYDFSADLEATTARALSIQFSIPVWDTPGVFVLPATTTYKTSQDLLAANQPILVVTGSAQDIALTGLTQNIQRLPDYNSVALALVANRAVAMFAGLGPAEQYVQRYPQLKILVPNPPIFDHGVAYGIRAAVDSNSVEAVNIAITNALANGSVARAFAAQHYVDINHLGAMQLTGN